MKWPQLHHRRSLFFKLAQLLLPAATIPLLVFGYLTIQNQYKTITDDRLGKYEATIESIQGLLEVKIARVKKSLIGAAQNSTLRAKNIFLIGTTLENIHLTTPEFSHLILTDADSYVLNTYPAQPDIEGKKFTTVNWKHLQKGLMISPIHDISSVEGTYFSLQQEIINTENQLVGYLIANVSLRDWITQSARIVSSDKDTSVALLIEEGVDHILSISKQINPETMEEILNSHTHMGSATQSLTIGKQEHLVTVRKIDELAATIALTQPAEAVFAPAQHQLFIYSIFLTIITLAVIISLLLITRNLTKPIRNLTLTAQSYSQGDYSKRTPYLSSDELGFLGSVLNNLGDSLDKANKRTDFVNEVIRRLFSAIETSEIIATLIHLINQQIAPLHAQFAPNIKALGSPDTSVIYPVNKRLNHQDATITIPLYIDHEISGHFLFVFENEERANEERSMLDALCSIATNAIKRITELQKAALISAELSIASTVQKALMNAKDHDDTSFEVETYYLPANRLGGDWFAIIKDKKLQQLYLMMGDVTGHGIAQGMVTAAIRGAITALEQRIQREDSAFPLHPREIMATLNTIVRQSSTDMNMTALGFLIK